MSQMQIRDIKQEKLDAEKTAFRNCRSDLSDISFEITQSTAEAKVFGAILLFAVPIGGRIMLRRMAGSPDGGMSAIDIGFWILMGCIALVTVIFAVAGRMQSGVSVSGKTVFYKGNCWSSDEISLIRCTKWLEHVEVYADGKKVISFPWSMEHSELLIAWARVCGIKFEDKRMHMFTENP